MDAAALTSARDRVLFHLKTRGPQTATQLAHRLGVTPMAVRLHLQTLAGEGMISFTDERRKVGRPSRIWSLLPAAARMFPDSHSELTVELLRAVRSTFGEEGLDRLVGERSRQQRDSYRERMPGADAPIQARVEALAAIRKDEGYMAEWSCEQSGWLLVENHCPICAAAAVCQGFCRDELEIFREVLGRDVSVERVDHLLAGARRCAYRIEKATRDPEPQTAGGSGGPASTGRAGGSKEGPA
ncbi:MAG TPA: metalloregulator ArsR/SmtB family transcription factor [Candidatus Limnocylindrales bacterium]|nr:metalloregulator ArsR/SmtB family transcription factor [Candidatus Limnocylindrales bacterium]